MEMPKVEFNYLYKGAKKDHFVVAALVSTVNTECAAFWVKPFCWRILTDLNQFLVFGEEGDIANGVL